jgi:hypothetical protein
MFRARKKEMESEMAMNLAKQHMFMNDILDLYLCKFHISVSTSISHEPTPLSDII